jgi:hypothetical protein
VIGEARIVDVLFEPDPEISRDSLGLLGKLLFVPCIIEPLRWSPNTWKMQSCLQNWLIWKIAAHGSIIPVDETPVYGEEEDEEEDDYDSDEEEEQIDKILLIIVPSIDRKIIHGFGLKPSSHKIAGLYDFPPAYHTTVVVTNELPQDPSTLWLRLLGRGPTQRRAIEELLHLKENHPHRKVMLKQLQQWYQLLSEGHMGRESKALMEILVKVKER